MITVSMQTLLSAPEALGIVPAALAGLAALRRSCLSQSSNFFAYIGVAAVAGAVCQVNILFLGQIPPYVLVGSGIAVSALWLEVRHRADSRRRVRTTRHGAKFRSTY